VASALFRLTGRQLHPALVGMAFALSFDAMAQAAFFASSGSQFSGMGAVVLLACAFAAGMLVADAANGALLNWFAGRSDSLARGASRFSSAFIAMVALLTASAGLLRLFRQDFALTWDQLGVWVGVGLVAFTSAVYSVRISLQKPRTDAGTPAR
jgi:high-affinity nickel permease